MDRPSPGGQENSRLKPREQGDLGELSAMEWLVSQGATIAIPVSHSPDWDLIAELGARPARVQVKTSTARDDRGCYALRLATSGGNQSWNRIIKRFDPSRYDYLFALVGDGRRWFIPSAAIEGTCSIVLGGAKYSEFEVDRGRPLLVASAASPLESTARQGEYPSGQRTAAVNRQALPSQVRILPPPSSSLAPPISARTRVSKKHQITIPTGPFRATGLRVGEALRVTAAGEGRLAVTRIEEPSDRP